MVQHRSTPSIRAERRAVLTTLGCPGAAVRSIGDETLAPRARQANRRAATITDATPVRARPAALFTREKGAVGRYLTEIRRTASDVTSADSTTGGDEP